MTNDTFCMKKLLLLSLVMIPLIITSQIKLTYVNPINDQIKIKNFGSGSVDITNYRFCALFEYANIAIGNVTIVAGDLNLSPLEEVTLTWNAGSGFNTTASDLGLYLPSGAFSSSAAMVDFFQYGAGGQGRENVANTAGLWTAGQFMTGTGPWFYTGNGSASGMSQWSAQQPGPYTGVRINELDPDQPGTDTAEFIELFGTPNTSLTGLVIVFFSGSNDQSYAAYDLDGQMLDAGGFFVLGSAIVPNVDMTFAGASNSIQNGADAVAIYAGDAANFPTGTPVTNANIVDAAVYGTDDAADAGLVDVLTPGQIQLNAVPNDMLSFSRVPDGGTALDVTLYVNQNPTPGLSNIPICSGATIAVVSGTLTQCFETAGETLVVINNSLYGNVYTYFLTNNDSTIINSSNDGSFDLNALAIGTYRIYGVSYSTTLTPSAIAPGELITGVLANDCYSLSNNFLTVTQSTCIAAVCDGGTVNTGDGNTYVSLCSDEQSDTYTLTNVNTGNQDGYAYFITDGNGLIIQQIVGSSMDFNMLPVGFYLVRGIAFMGTLDPTTIEEGDAITGILTSGSCTDLSDNSIQVNVLSCTLGEGCTRLFISEYIEGLSNNKAIELYNPTPFPIDLSDYDLFAYANGAVDFTAVVALSGIIQPGDVYVIANSQSNTTILAEADLTAGLTTFNGNDAIVLMYNLIPIDVIGIPGNDPGAAGWQFGNGSTTDKVLVRMPNVTSPTTNWTLSSGQWLIYPPTDFTHIGVHTALACSGLAYVTFEVAAAQVEENVGTLNIVINAFNVASAVPITINVSSESTTAGEDYVNIFPQTITFSPGNTTFTLSLEIMDENIEELLFEYLTLTMNDDDDLATFVNQSITISIAPSDLSYPLYTIHSVTQEDAAGVADSLGVSCSITGIVHGINFNPAGTEFTLIQGLGGIKVFDAAQAFGYIVLEGDSVVVQGVVSQFMGMTEFLPVAIEYISSGHALEVPALVTSLGEANESHMVRMNCVTLVDPAQWIQSGSGFDVDLTDGTNTFVMHVDLNTTLFTSPAPQGHFNMIGIGGQSDPDSPYDSGYVFWPRALTDLSGNIIAAYTVPATFIYGDNGAMVNYTSTGIGATTYSWSFGDGGSASTAAASHNYSFTFLNGIPEITISLTVTNGQGCADTFSNTLDVVYSSVNELGKNSTSVYPNPAENFVNLVSDRVIECWKIYDMNGRMIMNGGNIAKTQSSIDISSLASGLYHVEVYTDSARVSQKLVVR